MGLSLYELDLVKNSFFDYLEDKGYETMLYGSKNYLNFFWKYNKNKVWLAHYTLETDYEGDYLMWQLCQDGQIDGIDYPVDINVLYK